MAKRGTLARIDSDLYSELKKRASKNQTNLRIESRKLFTKYSELSEFEKKVRGKKVWVIGK